MRPDDPEPGDAATLRWQAEEAVRAQPARSNGSLSHDEALALVHELQVHQVELELQNEELERTRREAEALWDRYADLYDFAPVGYFTLDEAGAIREANLAGAVQLGVDRGNLIGARFAAFLASDSRSDFAAFLTRVLSSEATEACDISFMARPGHGAWYARLRGRADAAGAAGFLRLVVTDITDRRRVEEALRESEARFRVAQELSPDGFTILRPVRDTVGNVVDFTWVYENDAVARMNGTDPTAVIGKSLLSLFPGHQGSKIFEMYVRTAVTGETSVFEEMYRGETFTDPIWFRIVLVRMNGDIAILAQDITDRRRVDEALRETRDFLDSLINYANAPIIVWDPESRITRFNAAFGNLSGHAADEVIGRDLVMLFPEESREESLEKIQRTITERWQTVEIPILRPDGEVRIALWNSANIYDTEGTTLLATIAQGQDITKRKRAEEALRESEEKFRLLADFTADWESWIGPDGGCIYVSPSCEWISGRSAEEFYRDPELFATLVHPDDMAAYEEHLKFHSSREGGRESIDLRIVTAGGTIRWISHHCRPVFGRDGNWLGRRISNTDITDRKRAEEALREQEQTLQGIFRAAPVGIGMVSHRTITLVNDQLCRMTGHSRDELIGQDARIFYPSDEVYDQVGREKYAQVTADGTGAVETQWRTSDGTVLDILLRLSPIDLARPHENAVFSALDITPRRESERALKMYMDDLQRSNEELERFAYVASHDLQEPLRSIISFSQLIDRRYRGKLDADADEFIAFIVEGGNRMQQLITDLLQLSRVETKAQPLAPTDTGEVVADVLRLMETPVREAGATVTVDDLPMAMADAAQLEQVFSNLVGNAIKYRREGVPPEVRISAERRDGMVEFAVRDNGIGIEEQYFDRIFVIFQRLHTREEYEGTGIGLAVVRKIVERHGGRIRVESVPGEGSTFLFTLPAA